MNITRHGGGCCGIRHISGFGRFTTPEEIRRAIKDVKAAKGVINSFLIEAVLTDHQLRYDYNPGLVLRKEGFRLVTKFRNPNSGNICNVFHYTKRPL